MLKGNKKWQAEHWAFRLFVIVMAITLIVWWPMLSLVTSGLEYSLSRYVGAGLAALITFFPWLAGLLYAGYKEWFTE